MSTYTPEQLEKLQKELSAAVKTAGVLIKKAYNSHENNMMEEYIAAVKELDICLKSAESLAITLLNDALKQPQMY